MLGFHSLKLGKLFPIIAILALSVQINQATAQQQRAEVGGFGTPESITVGPDGNYYVADLAGFGVRGDGSVKIISGDPFADEATVTDFVTGLDDPKGMVFSGEDLIVADITQLLRITPNGEVSTFLAQEDFPGGSQFLNDMDIDAEGNMYISDTNRQVVFRVDTEGTATIFADLDEFMNGANGVLVDTEGHVGEPGSVLVVDLRFPGALVLVSPDGSEVREIARGFQGDGIAFDSAGNLYVSDLARGIFRIDEEGNARIFAGPFAQAADFTIDQEKNWMIVANFSGRRVTFLQL